MIAGIIAEQKEWPWVYWVITILTGVLLILFIFCYEETKYTVVTTSATEVSSVTKGDATLVVKGADEEMAKAEEVLCCLQTVDSVRKLNPSIPVKTYWQRLPLVSVTEGSFMSLLRHGYQPLIIMCAFPAVAFTALQYGGMLAWFSVVVTSQANFFSSPPYNFTTSQIGLLGFAGFIGGALAAVWSGWLSDWSIQKLAKRNNGVFEPEMRLYLTIGPIICLPAGLFIYGYSVAKVCAIVTTNAVFSDPNDK